MTAVARTGMREGSSRAVRASPVPSGRAEEPGECPRCGEGLEFRRRDAVQRAWRSSSPPRSVTSGQYPAGDADDHADVREARHHHQRRRLPLHVGSWYLALILLIASVMIPLAKLAPSSIC